MTTVTHHDHGHWPFGPGHRKPQAPGAQAGAEFEGGVNNLGGNRSKVEIPRQRIKRVGTTILDGLASKSGRIAGVALLAAAAATVELGIADAPAQPSAAAANPGMAYELTPIANCISRIPTQDFDGLANVELATGACLSGEALAPTAKAVAQWQVAGGGTLRIAFAAEPRTAAAEKAAAQNADPLMGGWDDLSQLSKLYSTAATETDFTLKTPDGSGTTLDGVLINDPTDATEVAVVQDKADGIQFSWGVTGSATMASSIPEQQFFAAEVAQIDLSQALVPLN